MLSMPSWLARCWGTPLINRRASPDSSPLFISALVSIPVPGPGLDVDPINLQDYGEPLEIMSRYL